MVKKVLSVVIICIISVIIDYVILLEEVNKKFNQFSDEIVTCCIEYKLENELFLVFDYPAVESVLDDIFTNEKVNLDIENATSFTVSVDVNSGFINKGIFERYRIEKGENYETYY